VVKFGVAACGLRWHGMSLGQREAPPPRARPGRRRSRLDISSLSLRLCIPGALTTYRGYRGALQIWITCGAEPQTMHDVVATGTCWLN
jgi:hypothetical protein